MDSIFSFKGMIESGAFGVSITCPHCHEEVYYPAKNYPNDVNCSCGKSFPLSEEQRRDVLNMVTLALRHNK